jgi:hypothetical protein
MNRETIKSLPIGRQLDSGNYSIVRESQDTYTVHYTGGEWLTAKATQDEAIGFVEEGRDLDFRG